MSQKKPNSSEKNISLVLFFCAFFTGIAKDRKKKVCCFERIEPHKMSTQGKGVFVDNGSTQIWKTKRKKEKSSGYCELQIKEAAWSCLVSRFNGMEKSAPRMFARNPLPTSAHINNLFQPW